MLPRGRLFSSRRYGQYGSYVTWKMLKTLALLYQPDSSTRPAWTARLLAKEAGMSYQGMQRLLQRCKKKKWVVYDRDALGRKAWTVTSDGMSNLNREINRKMVFEVSKKKTLAETTVQYVDRGMRALATLKNAGFTDIQARESLINHHIRRIEWAINQAEHRAVRNLGAYLWSLITNGNQQERRCRVYIERAFKGYTEVVRDSIVKEAMRTTKPFKSAIAIAANLYRWGGKRHGQESLFEVGEACILCSKKGLIKVKPVFYFADGAESDVA